MRKPNLFRIALIVCLVVGGSAFGQEKTSKEKPWFDNENCAFCKHITAQKGLMESMQCETFKINNGIMMVAIVPENMKASMAKADAAMDEVGKELSAGKALPMCGFCEAIGMAMQKGAKLEKHHGEHSDVTMFTSSDPEVVKHLHSIADRSIKEGKALKTKLSGQKTETTEAKKPTTRK